MPFVSLTEPDPRVMHATLVPPGTTEYEHAELAAQKLHRMVEQAEISEVVPSILRMSFERLRTIHMYGLLCYDLFTVVDDQALLLTEQVLRTRFVDLYAHRITFVKGDEDREFEAPWFEDVYEAVRSREYRGWRVRLRNGEAMPFDGSTKSLYLWARKEGLLSGHRNRHYEEMTSKQRNRVAHPERYHLTWEVDSARSIAELAQLINQLWGIRGAGTGRYTGTIHREVLAIGWNGDGQPSVGRAVGLPYWSDRDEYTVALVRAHFDDQALSELDTAFELTMFPVDELWGPGTADEAIAWLEEEKPTDDSATFHDRLFLIQEHDGRVDPPRRPEVAAALDINGSKGQWLLVEADHPTDAWVHAHNHFQGVSSCKKSGPCDVCSAETVAHGDLRSALDKVEVRSGAPVVPEMKRPVRVPGRRWMWAGVAPDSADTEEA